MAFFETFHQQLATVPNVIMEPIRSRCAALQADDKFIIGRSDSTLAEGTYIPFSYQGKVLNQSWYDTVTPLIEHIESLDIPCISGQGMYKVELSIVPPGGSLKWHHDIYVKDKLTERIHIPVITNPDTIFYAKWYADKSIYAFKMKQDTVYRFNNRVPHTVKNGGTGIRYHLLLNYMRRDILDYLLAHPDEMDSIDPATTSHRTRAIKAINTADELYYYVNHNVANAVKVTEHAPDDLTAVQLKRLIADVNTL